MNFCYTGILACKLNTQIYSGAKNNLHFIYTVCIQMKWNIGRIMYIFWCMHVLKIKWKIQNKCNLADYNVSSWILINNKHIKQDDR